MVEKRVLENKDQNGNEMTAAVASSCPTNEQRPIKRRRVLGACVHCHHAKAACSNGLPCKRCVKKNLHCIPFEHKKRGPKALCRKDVTGGMPPVDVPVPPLMRTSSHQTAEENYYRQVNQARAVELLNLKLRAKKAAACRAGGQSTPHSLESVLGLLSQQQQAREAMENAQSLLELQQQASHLAHSQGPRVTSNAQSFLELQQQASHVANSQGPQVTRNPLQQHMRAATSQSFAEQAKTALLMKLIQQKSQLQLQQHAMMVRRNALRVAMENKFVNTQNSQLMHNQRPAFPSTAGITLPALRSFPSDNRSSPTGVTSPLTFKHAVPEANSASAFLTFLKERISNGTIKIEKDIVKPSSYAPNGLAGDTGQLQTRYSLSTNEGMKAYTAQINLMEQVKLQQAGGNIQDWFSTQRNWNEVAKQALGGGDFLR